MFKLAIRRTASPIEAVQSSLGKTSVSMKKCTGSLSIWIGTCYLFHHPLQHKLTVFRTLHHRSQDGPQGMGEGEKKNKSTKVSGPVDIPTEILQIPKIKKTNKRIWAKKEKRSCSLHFQAIRQTFFKQHNTRVPTRVLFLPKKYIFTQ